MQSPADEVRARKNNGSGDVHLGEAWRLHKTSCGVARQAWCELRKHDLGWELLLFADASELRRSAVCRTSDELLSTSDTWKAAFVDRGWR
jgi:hypothetical protein